MPEPVFLAGDGITLHPMEEEDAEFLARIQNDPAVRVGTGRERPTTRADQQEFAEHTGDGSETTFLVTADGERVGLVALQDVRESLGHAEVGYLYAPEAWGNGYATDALRELVAYAFDERRLHKLYALLFADNDGSRRVLEKTGFRKEGQFPDHWYHDGEYRDRLQYGLAVERWHE